VNGETSVQLLLGGVLVGVAGTVTMDVLAILCRRLGLAVGAKGEWVGRWYLGIAQGRFLHANIAEAPEQPGETRAALLGHYIIGTALALFYVFGAEWVGVSPDSFLVAVGYGFGTCVFPWFLVFPALGFGAFGRKAPPALQLFRTSVLNHLGYGLGLWWSANVLRLGQ
jgi:hypothetical protein